MDRYTVQTTSQVILQLHHLTVSILTWNNSIPINATVNLSKLPWENWQNSTYWSFVGFNISKWKHTKAIFHTALNSRKTDKTFFCFQNLNGLLTALLPWDTHTTPHSKRVDTPHADGLTSVLKRVWAGSSPLQTSIPPPEKN